MMMEPRDKILDAEDILCTVGNTPMLKIGKIYAKLEAYNPTGSVKDRMVCYMIRKAEERGELKKGSQIIEVTSGNTGIALAMVSAVRGYRFTAIMPANMSPERIKMMKAFGANVILTPAKDDIPGAMKKYEEMVSKHPKAWLPNQFENSDNIEAHRIGLGKEIVDYFHGNMDAFVAGTGTGGTLIGVAKALKKENTDVRIFAVEPAESAVIKGEAPGIHKIQGIGEGFIPKIVQDNRSIIDGIIKIKSSDAIMMARKLAHDYGLLVGISSGANVIAAQKLSKKFKIVVTVLPDRGERYLSCGVFC
jgi:cysteine synthase A